MKSKDDKANALNSAAITQDVNIAPIVPLPFITPFQCNDVLVLQDAKTYRLYNRFVWRGRRRFGVILAIAVACLIAGVCYQSILTFPGRFLSLNERPEKSDLILVLAGDFYGNRVMTGAELGARGYANQVLFSGTPYQDTYQSDLSVEFAIGKGYHSSLFLTARHKARSTIEEAVALEPELRRLGARRIILVTNNFHSRRAALVFRLFVPDFEYRSVGAPDSQGDPESWWTTAYGRRLVLAEYIKIAGTIATKVSQGLGRPLAK